MADTPHHHRETCHLCGASDVVLVAPISDVPVLTPNSSGQAKNSDTLINCSVPLNLYQCRSCGHLQLLDIVDPSLLYNHYRYTTSISVGLAEHFQELAATVVKALAPAPGSLVVEIGSNDGTALRAFQQLGLKVQGVDPAQEIAERATRSGVPTLASFFTEEVARTLRAEHGPAALMTAHNVLANIDDLASVMRGVRHLLAPDGVLVMETQDGAEVIRGMLIDVIYHEHQAYFMAEPLQRFLATQGLEMIDIVPIATKGGSIRVTAQLAGGPRPVAPSVAERIAIDRRTGLYDDATYQAFAANIVRLKRDLAAEIAAHKAAGRTIAGYGTSVGTVCLLHLFGLEKEIEFLVDDNPLLSEFYGIGRRIPIVGRDVLEARQPGAVVVFAWRYTDLIVKKNQAYLDKGGRFIIPLPDLKVIPAQG